MWRQRRERPPKFDSRARSLAPAAACLTLNVRLLRMNCRNVTNGRSVNRPRFVTVADIETTGADHQFAPVCFTSTSID